MMSRSVRVATTIAVVAALAAACGGADQSDTAGPTPTPTPTASPVPSVPPTRITNAPGPGPVPGPTQADGGFAWVPWGPASPADPPPFQWYGNLERRDCGRLRDAVGDEPGRGLWRALAAVCAVVVDKDPSQWEVAKTAARSASGSDGSPCLEREARALLARALAWHERHPGEIPDVVFPSAGSPVACAFRIVEVHAVDENGDPVGGALAGPLSGGTAVVITGQGIDEPTAILFGGRPALPADDVPAGSGLAVRAPEGERPGPVQIRLRNRAGEVVAPVPFVYEIPESPS